MTPTRAVPHNVGELLACSTPKAWVEAALAQQDVLLMDHANCEKKAAATAVSFLFEYGDRFPDLQDALSRLAREELRHFEQVAKLMRRRGIKPRPMSAARYASGLRRHVRKREPERLTDLLVVGAFIEARSCERFRALTPVLDPDLSEFYRRLDAAESRHFQMYLGMARRYGGDEVEERIGVFREAERELIEEPDSSFRFHSGPPAA